jgi:hypothetical protein
MYRGGYSRALLANARSRRPSIPLGDTARIDLRRPDAESIVPR